MTKEPIVRSIELPNRVKIPYVERGDPSGVPLLLLHAIADSWRSFELVLSNLPGFIHALALTQRGHGDAGRPADDYHPRDFAADLAAAITGSRLLVYEGAGHAFYWEEPGRVAADIATFVAELGTNNRTKGRGTMSVQRNKETFRRYVDEVWKGENLDVADEIFAEKYLSHQSDGTVLERGPEDVKKFVTEYRFAFSDIENTVEDMIGEDDKVVNRWTLRATHTGEFRGIAATNKRIKITGIGIFRFSEDGKVVESWDNLDQLGMLRQLEAL